MSISVTLHEQTPQLKDNKMTVKDVLSQRV